MAFTDRRPRIRGTLPMLSYVNGIVAGGRIIVQYGSDELDADGVGVV